MSMQRHKWKRDKKRKRKRNEKRRVRRKKEKRKRKRRRTRSRMWRKDLDLDPRDQRGKRRGPDPGAGVDRPVKVQREEAPEVDLLSPQEKDRPVREAGLEVQTGVDREAQEAGQ